MENCDACSADAKQVICEDCNQGMCLACNLKKHLSGKLGDHKYELICEECEERAREFFCMECDEGLCLECEQKLHKKGTRVQHVRVPKQQSDNYKMLLNFVYLPGNICEQDVKTLIQHFQLEHIDLQLKFTIVHYHGEKGNKLSEFLGAYSLDSKPAPKINTDTILDYFVHTFDKKVFLNNVILVSEERLSNDHKQHFTELFPSAKIKLLPLFQNEKQAGKEFKCEEVIMNSPSKEKKKEQLQSMSSSRSLKLAKNDSKERITDVLGGLDTLNSISQSDLKKNSTQLSSLHKSLQSDRKLSNSLVASNFGTLLSSLISLEFLHKLNGINCSLTDYFTYYFGIKEWRHSPISLKEIAGAKLTPYPVPLNHIFNDLLLDPQLKREKSLIVQDILRYFAEEGKILVDYNALLKQVCLEFGGTETDARNLLLKMSDFNIIIINSRQITQTCNLNQVSFKLDILTLEDLYWTTLSLIKDKVTATEEIVLARLKEAFGLKIKPKVLQQLLDKFKDLIKKHRDSKIKATSVRKELLELCIETKMNPYVKNAQTLVFEIKSLNIPPEDVTEIDDDDRDWTNFKKFINEFFDEDLLIYNNVSSTAETKKKDNFLDKPIYNSEGGVSSSNIILNNTGTENHESTSKLNPSNSVTECSGVVPPLSKAISGGRYGLAQSIKNFGPEELKMLSIGRLSKLIQKAIDQGFLKYHQSFLVKTDELKRGAQTMVKTETDEKIKEKLDAIFNKIIECLIENKNCKPIAQLSEELSSKLGYKFDHRDFGYTKLTHFIEDNCMLLLTRWTFYRNRKIWS